jgi:hypothetical protein
MCPVGSVMVAVVMTRHNHNRYVTRREGSAESSSISGRSLLALVCVANALCESGTVNKATSFEFSSSKRTTSCAGLTRLLGSQLISLMAPGLVRGPGG